MLAAGQGGDHDVGDVAGVDERLCDVSGRRGERAGEHQLQPEALAEVLVHEARAYERPLCTRLADGLLTAKRSVLVPTGEQHQAADAALDRLRRERLDPLASAGEGEVGLIRDVR